MEANGSMSTSGSVAVDGWGEGTGTEEGGELEEGAIIGYNDDGYKTYTVSTAKGLLEWAKAVQDDDDLNLTLTEDIDMKGKTWPAIERYRDATIDGGGHTIKNLALTEKSKSDEVGLIAGTATNCVIKNLTLQNPSITIDGVYGNGGFFAEGMSSCTMENCHVIGGTSNLYSTGGFTKRASASSFTACSVTSSGVAMIERISVGGASEITACYVTGGKLVVDEGSTPTYTDSYYQESADGGITAAGDGSTTVDTWTEAATQMNAELSETSYQWVENSDKEDTDRPLVIKTQTTD